MEDTVTLQDIGSMIDKKAIAEQVAKKIQQEIADSVYYGVARIVQEEIDALVKEQIKEIVRGQSQTILDGVTKAMPAVAQALGEAMVEKAVKNLSEKSYNRDSIVGSIFK